MKVTFQEFGVLTVEPENPLEYYALYNWMRDGEQHGVLHIKLDEGNALHCGGSVAQSLNWLAHNEGHFSEDDLRAELRKRRTTGVPT